MDVQASSTTQYVLAVGNTVDVPVTLKIKDRSQEKTYKFTLFCERLEADEIADALKEKDLPIKDFLARVVKGWDGQKLVLDQNNNPAPFNEATFAVMLTVAGAATAFLNSYLKECGAKSKN